MLSRTLALLLCTSVGVLAAPLSAQQLVGQWRSELGDVLTFRRDHTFTNRTATITITGTWFVRGHRLVRTNKSLNGSADYTNSCDIILQRDQFSYGMCEHTETRSGRSPTSPELYTMGVVYHRVRHD